MTCLPVGLRGLASYAQFILWKPVTRPNGHVDKIPCDPRTGEVCDAHDAGLWVPAEAAFNALRPPYGVGFVFADSDPYFFLDVDNCLTPGGLLYSWNDVANDAMRRFQGAAMATSSGGRGLHIIGQGSAPQGHKTKSGTGLELYTKGRFVALSLNPTVGDCNTRHDAALNTLVAELFTRDEAVEAVGWTDTPVAEYTGPVDDDELVRRAVATVSPEAAFTGKATFKDLWEGNEAALGVTYPDDHGERAYNASAADAALAAHLAFWTGKNCERIKRLMIQSALARHKWDARESGYLDRTILGAVAVAKGVYDYKAPTPAELFPGCVYIAQSRRVLLPNGQQIKPEAFKEYFGGQSYPLYADKTTRNAFKAATEGDFTIPKVHTTRFRPLEAPGAIVERHGVRSVNTFRAQFGEAVEGDVTPFLEHVAKLLPDEGDREIYLSYLAACVQMTGIKFQWAPVLQGTQGNGKTVMYTALEYALGANYCFQLNAADVENKFNGWISEKLLVGIEELRIKGRMTMADVLKPMITNERVSIQNKGVDQTTGDNFANFLIFSNHKDAVLKVRDDRRYCVFFTAQQSYDDLMRDGMDGAYFMRLYGWLKGPGRAAIAHYLATRPISVNVLDRTPETTSTDEAYLTSLGPVEQCLIEALETESPGFKDDAIEFGAAMEYLRVYHRGVTPRTLVNALDHIGFRKPPALRDSNKRISIDGRRVRIYVRRGSAAAAIETRDELRAFWVT